MVMVPRFHQPTRNTNYHLFQSSWLLCQQHLNGKDLLLRSGHGKKYHLYSRCQNIFPVHLWPSTYSWPRDKVLLKFKCSCVEYCVKWWVLYSNATFDLIYLAGPRVIDVPSIDRRKSSAIWSNNNFQSLTIDCQNALIWYHFINFPLQFTVLFSVFLQIDPWLKKNLAVNIKSFVLFFRNLVVHLSPEAIYEWKL